MFKKVRSIFDSRNKGRRERDTMGKTPYAFRKKREWQERKVLPESTIAKMIDESVAQAVEKVLKEKRAAICREAMELFKAKSGSRNHGHSRGMDDEILLVRMNAHIEDIRKTKEPEPKPKKYKYALYQ